MKRFRIAILTVLIIVPFTGYLFAVEGLPLPEEFDSVMAEGSIIDTGGCGLNIDLEKVPAIMRFESNSGNRTIHGVLGLFRVGLMGGKTGKDFCSFFGSSSDSCKTVDDISDGGVDVSIKRSAIKDISVSPGIKAQDVLAPADLITPQKGLKLPTTK